MTEPPSKPPDPTGDLPYRQQQSDASTIGHHEPRPEPEPVEGNIGAYRIIREIGRGGMGLVYLAASEGEQFRRRVAIKVLKRGMDTEDVLKRFEFERQVLGALNHPGIARLYDAGETEDGRPYLVMEFIEGMPIDAYCDRHALRIDDRLRLFRDVCSAVHYAHQNLVIHRDIKPSNIFVTKDGTPKLLDFGIAKLVNPDLALMSGDPTAPEMRVMTPEYASPEQVRGEPITTATDVYSLGVLLYELLSGKRPYRLQTRMLAEINRVICEVDPERPSVAVTRSLPTDADVTPESIGRARETRPDQLRRRLSGDIDNIVLLAMRKDTLRRYKSAEQLAEDISRHLDGRPVIARPDTFGYRFTKFVRRNRAAVAAGVAIVVLLFGGIIATSLAWRSAERAQKAEREQRARADHRFEQVQELANTFLFDFHDSIRGLPGSLEARDLIVSKGLEYLDALAAEAGDDMTLQRDLARAYHRIGEIRGSARGANQGDREGALESFRTAERMQRALLEVNPDDPELLADLATSCFSVGDMLRRKGDLQGAIDTYGEVMEIRQELLAPDPESVPARRSLDIVLSALGAALRRNGDTERGSKLWRQSLALRKELALAQPRDLTLQRDLSVAYIRSGRLHSEAGDQTEAAADYRKALRIRQDLRRQSPDDTTAQRDLGVAHLAVGAALLELERTKDAIEHFGHNLAIAQALEHASPTDVRAKHTLAVAHQGLGEALMEDEQWDAAMAHFASMRKLVEDNPQLRNRETMHALAHELIGGVLAEQGRLSEAIGHGREAIGILEALTTPTTHGRRHDLARARMKLGSWLKEDDQTELARSELERARGLYEQLLDSDPTNTMLETELEETRGALGALED